MKKLLYTIAVAAAALLSAACQKDEPGGTEAQALAGQWYIQVDAVDASNNVTYEDPYGAGRFIVLTYNTADNNTTDIFVDDLGNFWDFKVQAKADINSLSFAAPDADNLSYDSKVTITDGKITLEGATTPSGQPADYIEFYVVFDDDDYIGSLYDRLKFSGWRYTGFSNDD